MAKNPHYLGSVLFGFYDCHGSVGVLVKFVKKGFGRFFQKMRVLVRFVWCAFASIPISNSTRQLCHSVTRHIRERKRPVSFS